MVGSSLFDGIISYWRKFTGGMSEKQREKVDVLNSIKLFEYCRAVDLVEIASESRFEGIEPGEKVIEEGEEGDGLYMVDSGLFEVRLSRVDEPVGEFGPGEYFGEMALLEDKPRSADVVCSEAGRLLFFSRDGFQELLRSRSQASFRFLLVQARTLSRRLRKANRKLREE